MIVTRDMANEAAELLGLVGFYEEADVSRAYRERARETHPDAGGSAEAFAAVDRAKHVLINWLERRGERGEEPKHAAHCPRCEGKGYVELPRAWRSMRSQCPRCRGTGDEAYEHEKGDHR